MGNKSLNQRSERLLSDEPTVVIIAFISLFIWQRDATLLFEFVYSKYVPPLPLRRGDVVGARVCEKCMTVRTCTKRAAGKGP